MQFNNLREVYFSYKQFYKRQQYCYSVRISSVLIQFSLLPVLMLQDVIHLQKKIVLFGDLFILQMLVSPVTNKEHKQFIWISEPVNI